ncbi:MAG: carboxylating nicotinate-nucleotide diphosphorylase [Candidatus Omnitrophica bacterium]|nr:carboxylating nicotinate-nucleotide diphosphorylase [Candidatus Omnitrophota bacterium]
MHINKAIKKFISLALAEDSASRDVTTGLLISEGIRARAKIIAKEPGVLCGLDIAKTVFKQLDKRVVFRVLKKEGAVLTRFEEVALIRGPARAILQAERIALNFLSFLSATATLTAKFIEQVKGIDVKIMDTRKTIPNLRCFQKYAVSVGGGINHRSSLSEAVLIKDNHLKAGCFFNKKRLDSKKLAALFGSSAVRTLAKAEVEVENLDEFKQVIKLNPGIIMLDNFSLVSLKKAVRLRNEYCLRTPSLKQRILLEASGGIALKNIRAVALTGVDRISIGLITHSPKAIDFSLEII